MLLEESQSNHDSNYLNSWNPTSHDVSRPIWITLLRRQCKKYLDYKSGWDSYNGQPINPDAMEFAASFLGTTAFAQLDCPFIAPTSNGGVQVEWNIGNTSLEIEFRSLTALEYYYKNGATEKEGSDSVELNQIALDLSFDQQ